MTGSSGALVHTIDRAHGCRNISYAVGTNNLAVNQDYDGASHSQSKKKCMV